MGLLDGIRRWISQNSTPEPPADDGANPAQQYHSRKLADAEAAAKPVPRFDPNTSTEATQRHLRALGWEDPDQEAPQAWWVNALKKSPFPVQSTEDFAPHSYSLTRWQAEQAEKDYGVGLRQGDYDTYLMEGGSLAPTVEGDRHQIGDITEEGWNSLAPHQQRAVEWNDLLTQAVRRDRAAQDDVDAAERRSYDRRVADMFGTQGGSKTYAPATMALLERLDLGNLRGQDLDEYLSLDRAFTASELQSLQAWDAPPELPASYEGFAASRSQERASTLDARQAAMAGQLIEESLSEVGWDEASRVGVTVGGDFWKRPGVDEIPYGWLLPDERRGSEEEQEKEGLYQAWWGRVLDRNRTDIDDFWIETGPGEYAFTEEDYVEIFDYFYQKSLEADRLGIGDDTTRSGAEVRQFLGMEG